MSNLTRAATRAQVLDDYINTSLTVNEIAHKHGVSAQMVSIVARKAGVSRRDSNSAVIERRLKKAVEYYVRNEVSVPFCASKHKVGNTTLRARLIQLNIPIRACTTFGSKALALWRKNRVRVTG